MPSWCRLQGALDVCLHCPTACVDAWLFTMLLLSPTGVHCCREASRKALSSLSTVEIVDMKSPRMPAFERTVTQAAAAALDEWKKEAMMGGSRVVLLDHPWWCLDACYIPLGTCTGCTQRAINAACLHTSSHPVATALVEMESDYITSAYFRRAIANRAMVFEEQEPFESPVKGSEEEEEEEEDDEDDDDSTEDDEDDDPKPKRAPSRRVQGDFDPNDLKAGYLEKRIGEGSGRGAIPVESWKWQKRWFIFTDTKAMLYYFKSPDDPPNYRGAINIRCVVDAGHGPCSVAACVLFVAYHVRGMPPPLVLHTLYTAVASHTCHTRAPPGSALWRTSTPRACLAQRAAGAGMTRPLRC